MRAFPYLKQLVLLFLIIVSNPSYSQFDVQFHYDFGRHLYPSDEGNRQYFTTTVENFTPDNWGSTYLFVDFDYRNEDAMSAYWEISRELKFWQAPLAVHVEYNGGLNTHGGFGNAYLAGPALNLHSQDFSKTLSVQALYKYLAKADQPHSWQLTLVWGNTFANGKATFCGFMDLWHDNRVQSNLVFLSEPQLWVNLNKFKGVHPKFNLSIGTEVELSSHFVYSAVTGKNTRFYVNPTLALKWTLN